jgi:hypothetical protein
VATILRGDDIPAPYGGTVKNLTFFGEIREDAEREAKAYRGVEIKSAGVCREGKVA